MNTKQKLEQQLNTIGSSLAALEREFRAAVVHRGIVYYENSYVITPIDISTIPDLVLLQAKVRGSGARPYGCWLELRQNIEAKLQFKSSCSCPMNNRCKHVVAALCAFLLESDSQALQSLSDHPELIKATRRRQDTIIKDWLDSLRDVQPSSSPSASSHHRVYYCLEYFEPNAVAQRIGNTPASCLALRVGKAKTLKNGHLSTLSNVNFAEIKPQYISHLAARDFDVQLEDCDIVELLHVNRETQIYQNHRDAKHLLRGEVGEIILKKLLNSQRCYWKDHQTGQLLGHGEASEMQLQWRLDEGFYRCGYAFENGADLAVEVGQWHYIDTQKALIGEVSNLPADLSHASKLLSAPPIPADQAEAISASMLQMFPDRPPPLPVEVSLQRIAIPASAFQPRLRIHQFEAQEGVEINIATLSFVYDQVEIFPENVEVLQRAQGHFIDKDRHFVIDRDNQSEVAAFNELASLGLLPVPDAINDDIGLNELLMHDPQEQDRRHYRAIHAWHHFITNECPQLSANGWDIQFMEEFNLGFVDASAWHGEISGDNQWLDLALDIEVEGKQISLLAIVLELLEDSDDPRAEIQRLRDTVSYFVEYKDNQWLNIPGPRLATLLQLILEVHDDTPLENILDDGHLRINRLQVMQIADLFEHQDTQWKGAKEVQALQQKLSEFNNIETVQVPLGLNAELRDYQKQGLNWLVFLREYQFNGVLADDMGLGKTVQTLALLLHEQQHSDIPLRPSLIVAPTSLMGNWRDEAAKFAPSLSVLVLHGPQRHADFARIDQFDIVVTSYPLIGRDIDTHRSQDYHYLILDEAQAIKNPKAKATQFLAELKTQHRLCLTGTPMENHLGELWSIFNFLMPGFLGNQKHYNKHYRNPIEKEHNHGCQQQLNKRVRPFMLRRSKDRVATELPPKTEIIQRVNLSGAQRDLYETTRVAMDKKVRAEIAKKGLARSHIMILDALLKLRQCCCDPRLLKLKAAEGITTSAKLSALGDLLDNLLENKRKILIFSQFTSMLSLIEALLKTKSMAYTKLTGQTRNRETAIAAFKDPKIPIFLISLKAGGTGLNLTDADTVIHYDPWWNPAAENQATDRAYRIGQDKPVFVYKLIVENSIEEKILALQEKKQAIADNLYEDKDSAASISQQNLLDLLSED